MTLKNVKIQRFNWKNHSATRIVVSTIGILIGLAGIEHGFFEILQGDIVPDSLMITAIGPDQRFWVGAAERALTIIPSYLITGIAAMIIGLILTIWVAAFVNRKYGASILLILSISLFLAGGGFGPLYFGVFASILSTKIDSPLKWWKEHLPVKIQDFFAKLWPSSIIAFALIFTISVVIAIFGYPFLWFFDAATTEAILWIIAFFMLGLVPIATLSAFSYDIQGKNQKNKIKRRDL